MFYYFGRVWTIYQYIERLIINCNILFILKYFETFWMTLNYLNNFELLFTILNIFGVKYDDLIRLFSIFKHLTCFTYCKLLYPSNTPETPLQHPWHTLIYPFTTHDTSWTNSQNSFFIPLKHPWTPLELPSKTLKHPWNTLDTPLTHP